MGYVVRFKKTLKKCLHSWWITRPLSSTSSWTCQIHTRISGRHEHRRWRAEILLWRHDQQVLLQFCGKTSRSSRIWSVQTLWLNCQISPRPFGTLAFLALPIRIYFVASGYWIHYVCVWKHHIWGKYLLKKISILTCNNNTRTTIPRYNFMSFYVF